MIWCGFVYEGWLAEKKWHKVCVLVYWCIEGILIYDIFWLLALTKCVIWNDDEEENHSGIWNTGTYILAIPYRPHSPRNAQKGNIFFYDYLFKIHSIPPPSLCLSALFSFRFDILYLYSYVYFFYDFHMHKNVFKLGNKQNLCVSSDAPNVYMLYSYIIVYIVIIR